MKSALFVSFFLLQSWNPALAQQGACEPGTATQLLDGNDVAAALFNTGTFFWRGSGNTYRVPRNGLADAIFNTSLWIGGMAGGELRMSAATYGPFEFFPGPLGADGSPPGDCAEYDRIYKVTREDLAEFEATGIPSPDLRDWPHQLGAPVIDGDGNPGNYDLMAGDRPALTGTQVVWWVMNDAGGTRSDNSANPLPVEVRVTASAISRDTFSSLFGSSLSFLEALHATTFYRIQVLYRGTEPLDDAYVGFFADVDLGDASDDYAGSDSALGLAYAYNGDDFDGGINGYGDRPPAIGYDFVQGLSASNDGIDNDRDGSVDEEGERVQMTYFIVPSKGGGPQDLCCTGPDYYQFLRGVWRDGSPMTFGGTGYGGETATTFMYPGAPPEYWSMENADGAGQRLSPSDKRFLFGMGPLTIRPGEERDFTLAIVWAQGEDRLASVRKLKAADEQIQLGVDSGLLEPDARWLEVSTIKRPNTRRTLRSGLKQNHPNPASGLTTIAFEVAEHAHVTITVHDLLGREVARLVDGSRVPGPHETSFDAGVLTAGVYFYRMSAHGATVTRKLIVID